MAKGKKNKGSGARPKPSSNESSAAKKAELPEIVTKAQVAYDLGNHSAVRALAASAQGAHLEPEAQRVLDETLEKIKTDPIVWAVGVAAFAVAILVALWTLGA